LRRVVGRAVALYLYTPLAPLQCMRREALPQVRHLLLSTLPLLGHRGRRRGRRTCPGGLPRLFCVGLRRQGGRALLGP
jgi:hypothetical protein